MAEIVARKLVENGQERILQRIFDGVTSDLTLDVSDYKESDEHKLLHLVWRKFPRKRSTAYGQKTDTSDFIQTTEMMNKSYPYCCGSKRASIHNSCKLYYTQRDQFAGR